MPKRTEGRETQFLTEEEERRLGESLRKALISDRPNPNREGCPDPKTLRDLAFHRRMGDPEVFERATVHMAECSACVRDALGYAEEYKDLRKKNRGSRRAHGDYNRAGGGNVILDIFDSAAQGEESGNRERGPARSIPSDAGCNKRRQTAGQRT